MTAPAPMVHEATVGVLGLEIAAALPVATVVAGLLVFSSRVAAVGSASICLIFFLPALAAAALLGPAYGTMGLVIAMTPVLIWAWLRLPRGQWRTARALNGSAMRVMRVLVAPALAPLLCAAFLLGVAAMGLRWRLESHPAPLVLPDPVSATG